MGAFRCCVHMAWAWCAGLYGMRILHARTKKAPNSPMHTGGWWCRHYALGILRPRSQLGRTEHGGHNGAEVCLNQKDVIGLLTGP